MNNDSVWYKAEREKVFVYLKHNVEEFNDVGEYPAFDVVPYFAIWAVESSVTKGMVGFWAFSGDLPTDVIQRNWKDCIDKTKHSSNNLSSMFIPKLKIDLWLSFGKKD